MQNSFFHSAGLLLLLISFTAPQFTSAQFEDLGKGLGSLGNALGNALSEALACAQKIESSGCNSEAKGINLASGELNAPSAGYSQQICCSLKDYGRCVSRQLGEDAQCKDWAGGVATKMEQKFADNCAAYKDVCSASAGLVASSSTTLGAAFLLLLLYTLSTRLVSV